MNEKERQQYLEMDTRIFVRALRDPNGAEEFELSEGQATRLMRERVMRAVDEAFKPETPLKLSEGLLRDIIVCAFLEGGSCVWTARDMGIELTPEKVSEAAETYFAAAFPHFAAHLAKAQG